VTDAPDAKPPDAYVHAGGALLLAGVLNVGAALVWLGGLFASCWGIVFCFVPVLLVVDGIFEAWTGWRMIQGDRVPGARRRAITSAVISFVTCLGLFGCLVEIYAIWSLSKPDVQAWLATDAPPPDPVTPTR
jgi:hypothetical protein